MASVQDSIPHLVRTANDPRQRTLHYAYLSRIEHTNSRIRLLRLSLAKGEPPLHHLPGQYVDLYIPHIPVTGGFTITSAPSTASSDSNPYVELAIQASPNNPPAAWLWRSPMSILNHPVSFRIGGAFSYPPATPPPSQRAKIKHAVFVAGGVGINPVMSMVSYLHEAGLSAGGGGDGAGEKVHVPKTMMLLYTTKVFPPAAENANVGNTAEETSKNVDQDLDTILFYKRLEAIASFYKTPYGVPRLKFDLFTTNITKEPHCEQNIPKPSNGVTRHNRRLAHEDVLKALSPDGEQREPGQRVEDTVAYVCGPPKMTDELVELLQKVPGMEGEGRVLCEKWW